jgi:hypothetical protein
MRILSRLISPAICFGLFAACGDSQKPTTSPEQTAAPTASVDTAPIEAIDEKVDFKFHVLISNIPSPLEQVDALPAAGYPFNKSLLNPVESEKNYLTSMKKALNFGVYSVDMAYLTTNDDFNSLKTYMNTAQNLSKSLELSEVFNKVVAGRLKNNAENKDTIKAIIDEAYYEVDSYMRNNERALTSTQMLTGSWVESQFITLSLIKDDSKNDRNKILFDKVFEQKRHAESLASLLKEYEKEKEFAIIISEINKINAILKEMKASDVENKVFLNRLFEAIKNLRSLIVK